MAHAPSGTIAGLTFQHHATRRANTCRETPINASDSRIALVPVTRLRNARNSAMHVLRPRSRTPLNRQSGHSHRCLPALVNPFLRIAPRTTSNASPRMTCSCSWNKPTSDVKQPRRTTDATNNIPRHTRHQQTSPKT